MPVQQGRRRPPHQSPLLTNVPVLSQSKEKPVEDGGERGIMEELPIPGTASLVLPGALPLWRLQAEAGWPSARDAAASNLPPWGGRPKGTCPHPHIMGEMVASKMPFPPCRTMAPFCLDVRLQGQGGETHRKCGAGWLWGSVPSQGPTWSSPFLTPSTRTQGRGTGPTARLESSCNRWTNSWGKTRQPAFPLHEWPPLSPRSWRCSREPPPGNQLH